METMKVTIVNAPLTQEEYDNLCYQITESERIAQNAQYYSPVLVDHHLSKLAIYYMQKLQYLRDGTIEVIEYHED